MVLEAIGLTPTGGGRRIGKRLRRLDAILEDAESWEAVYAALGDDASRRLLVWLLAYRVLGRRHVRLPTNTPEYWSAVRRALGPMRVRRGVRRVDALDGWLDEFDVSSAGTPSRLVAHATNIVQIFALGQYRWRGDAVAEGREIVPRDGDVVIDAGGCWGDTALWFAHRVGPSGRVISLEFSADNLVIFRENLDCNPDLAARIGIVEHALWGESGAVVSAAGTGPGSRLSAGDSTVVVSPSVRGADRVSTITIDDLVDREGLDRVDFIKMDIEGAELAGLRGGERTLRRFRPRLAICVYHSLADMREIPLHVLSLDLGYKIHLGHASIHEEETVLFAEAAT